MFNLHVFVKFFVAWRKGRWSALYGPYIIPFLFLALIDIFPFLNHIEQWRPFKVAASASLCCTLSLVLLVILLPRRLSLHLNMSDHICVDCSLPHQLNDWISRTGGRAVMALASGGLTMLQYRYHRLLVSKGAWVRIPPCSTSFSIIFLVIPTTNNGGASVHDRLRSIWIDLNRFRTLLYVCGVYPSIQRGPVSFVIRQREHTRQDEIHSSDQEQWWEW